MINKEKWLRLLRKVAKEYPFGPFKETRNEEGNLHADGGPAYISLHRCIWYQNGRKHGLDVDIYGSKTYFFRGVMIPPHFAEHSATLELKEILNNPNAEVRRVGLEIYGFERMEKEGLFKVIDKDPETKAQLLQFKGEKDEEPVTLVRVLNATKEPDGTRKIYFLCVPPDMKTCKQAIAWTFRLEASKYIPKQES